MFDSHCHLTDIDDPSVAIATARASGVGEMLTCGYDEPSNEAVSRLAKRHPDLHVAIGLHPWHADGDIDAVLKRIVEVRPAAVGEAGLDLWGEEPCHPLSRQAFVLEAQLQLAGQLGLPVTLHSRKAVDALFSIVRNHPRVRGALHAYSGSWEQVKPFLDLGYYVGVGGAVTRSRAKRVRRCAASLPLDRLVLETDAPAIGMDGVEPPDVRPEHLPRVLAALSELRGVDRDELEAATTRNAHTLFGIRARALEQNDAR